MNRYFLGLDASTQSMTATVIDCENPNAIIVESVNFDRDLPQYKTSSGAVTSAENKLEVWSYPTMWLDALEMLLGKLGAVFDLSKISAIGGSGQQHASVYLSDTEIFSNLRDAGKGKLAEAVKNHLSREHAPIWMDASTARECAEITESAGGENYVLQTTGSVATERFTGAQIRKIFKREPDAYANTKRIHLNSSFMCSILSGRDAPVDLGDGAGMNLMNLREAKWDAKMLEATAPNLLEKLPFISARQTPANISPFFCKNYGFSADTKVCVFTGDNPSSLVGTGASQAGSAAISLGTSDTFFCANNAYTPADNAHIMGNPSGGFMNLICFRNGSLAREALKKELGVSWDFFDNAAFKNTMPHDDGKFALPFYFDEISPRLASSAPEFIGVNAESAPKDELVRLFVEGQFFNMYLQAKKMDALPSKIILTGGAARSEGIAQTIADIFNAPVYHLNSSGNSAALGAALVAALTVRKEDVSVLENSFCKREIFKTPRENAVQIYKAKSAQFSEILNERLARVR